MLANAIKHSESFTGGSFEHQDLQKVTNDIQCNIFCSGENIAKFSGPSDDPAKKCMDMWENSEGHLANILRDNSMTVIGIFQKNGWTYCTQTFGLDGNGIGSRSGAQCKAVGSSGLAPASSGAPAAAATVATSVAPPAPAKPAAPAFPTTYAAPFATLPTIEPQPTRKAPRINPTGSSYVAAPSDSTYAQAYIESKSSNSKRHSYWYRNHWELYHRNTMSHGQSEDLLVVVIVKVMATKAIAKEEIKYWQQNGNNILCNRGWLFPRDTSFEHTLRLFLEVILIVLLVWSAAWAHRATYPLASRG
jgi:hypothetical protein